MGQNPAVGGHNAQRGAEGARQARLDGRARRLRDGDAPRSGTTRRRCRAASCGPKQIKTEIFFLPAALPGEKEGTFTNTQRLIQYHDKAIEPPGDARSDLWFIYHLGRRLKELYADSTDPRTGPSWTSPGTTRLSGRQATPASTHIVQGDQRVRVGDRWEDRKQLGELHRAEGRRHHGLRLLDLLRDLPRRRDRTWPRTDRRPRRQSGQPSGLGLRLAGQPAHHVQPLLAPTPAGALVGAQEATSGGTTTAGKLGRLRRARLPRRQDAGLRPPTRRARAWTRSRAATHSS